MLILLFIDNLLDAVCRQCQPLCFPLLYKLIIIIHGGLPLPMLINKLPQHAMYPLTGDLLIESKHILDALEINSQYVFAFVFFVMFGNAHFL